MLWLCANVYGNMYVSMWFYTLSWLQRTQVNKWLADTILLTMGTASAHVEGSTVKLLASLLKQYIEMYQGQNLALI